jgi:hypothetical protein
MCGSKQDVCNGYIDYVYTLVKFAWIASNFLFTNTKCASPFKLIPLECNGELETTLWIAFTNLLEFGEWKIAQINKYISMGLVLALFPDSSTYDKIVTAT